MTKKTISFEESLGDDDYGLIISKDGELKGLWMPESENSELDFVPEPIVRILEGVYGMDLGDEVTLH